MGRVWSGTPSEPVDDPDGFVRRRRWRMSIAAAVILMAVVLVALAAVVVAAAGTDASEPRGLTSGYGLSSTRPKA